MTGNAAISLPKEFNCAPSCASIAFNINAYGVRNYANIQTQPSNIVDDSSVNIVNFLSANHFHSNFDFLHLFCARYKLFPDI